MPLYPWIFWVTGQIQALVTRDINLVYKVGMNFLQAFPVLLIPLITGIALPNPVGAVDQAVPAQKLERVREQIRELQQQLNTTIGKRDRQSARLRDVELEISRLVRKIHDTQNKMGKGKTELERLNKKESRQRQVLLQHIHQLEQQMQASYQLGRQAYLKLLLNQDDPARTSRMLVYYRYLNNDRSTRIEATRKQLQELQSTRNDIGHQTRELKKLETARIEEKTALVSVQQERANVLAGLNQEVRAQARSLQALKENEQRLLDLVRQVGNYMAELPAVPELDARFSQARGKLKLPTRGRLWASYGSPRNMGDLRWKGLFINAAEGGEVRAVFRGRVAYADWLHGFGLLLIIEHGDGYMSLYGHNRSLLKEVGDWVETGDIVASTGNTGNPPQAGLYFEIRHNGQPRDPLKWCRTS